MTHFGLLVIQILLVSPDVGQNNNPSTILEQYLNQTKYLDDSQFLENLLRSNYYNIADIHNFTLLEQHCDLLDRYSRDSFLFFELVFQEKVRRSLPKTLDINKITPLLELADRLNRHKSKKRTYFFLGLKDVVLRAIAEHIALLAHRDFTLRYTKESNILVKELRVREFEIDFPRLTYLEKITYHIKKGNWKYLINRAPIFLEEYITQLGILFIFCLSIVTFFARKRIFMPLKNKL